MADSNSDWKDEDLKSFWSHYELIQQWVKIADQSRLVAINDYEWQQVENDLSALLNYSSSKAVIDVEEEEAMGGEGEEEVEMTPEMVEFFKTTMEHRAKRDQLRKIEEEQLRERQQADGAWLNDDDNMDYVSASDVGIFGVQRRTVQDPKMQEDLEEYKRQMRELYGNAAEKMMAMEWSLNFSFIEQMRKHDFSLWPNIPYRI